MTSHIVNIQSRSVPLFLNKDIKVSPGTSTSIQLSGDLPCTFTSGTAIIRVQLVEPGFSFNTIEVEFLDQSTCIHVSNRSNRSVYFYKDLPIAYFDLRLIGLIPFGRENWTINQITGQFVTFALLSRPLPDQGRYANWRQRQTFHHHHRMLYIHIVTFKLLKSIAHPIRTISSIQFNRNTISI